MSTCPHCLGSIEKKTKPRSLEQMRRFFAVLRAMYAHWPEKASFQPHSEEHLRAWVTCTAGHREVETTEQLPPIADDAMRELVKGIIERAYSGGKRFPRWRGDTCAVYVPKSIAFHKLSQSEFNRLNDEVEAVYASETGLDPETVLREHERAA